MLLRPLLRPVLRPLLRNLFALAPAKAVPDPDAPIRELFANGEPGWWWDISDFSTMFQDGGGTMPVTGPGQPVGLILDKRLGLKRGAELMPNGDFSAGDAGWTISGGSSAPWAIADGVASVAADPDSASRYLTRSNIMEAGRVYDAGFDILASNGVGGVRLMNSADNAGPFGLSVGRHRHLLRAAGSSPTALVIQANVGWAGSIDNVSVREIPGNHEFQVTATRRPVLQQDVDGFFFLEHDGIDDLLQTNAIDFTGEDKMVVWMGASVLIDAQFRIAIELGPRIDVNAGGVHVMHLLASGQRTHAVLARSLGGSGTVGRDFLASQTVRKEVQTFAWDLASADAHESINMQIDGQDATPSNEYGSFPSGGAFGNHPLFIGGRSTGSYPFRGRVYSLIVRGAPSTPAQIALGQEWVNSKTGVY